MTYKLIMSNSFIDIILIQKTYQFINVVNGVSHSHKTANIFFSFDFLVAFYSNFLSGMHGFRDNEVLLQT